MSIKFCRVVVGRPTPYKQIDTEKNWKVFQAYDSEDPDKITWIREDKKAFGSDRDSAEMLRKTIVEFLIKCDLGNHLSESYDSSQCHQAFDFDREGKNIKVWRIWKGGDVRLYFVYVPDTPRCILLLKALAKRQRKLKRSDEIEIESRFDEAKPYFKNIGK